ncbi:MAG TPA: HIT family protein [Planctomycetota bacterium]|nr:HIT family protein [Planctomycetota bacterium]
MAKTDCIFCKIIDGSISSEKIYEDDDVTAILDISPVTPGHTLVIPKTHSKDFMSTEADVLARLVPTVQKIAKQVVKGVKADGFALVVFNGPAAGQDVFHLHIHIIPRKMGDGVRVGWPKAHYEPGQMAKVAEQIRKK